MYQDEFCPHIQDLYAGLDQDINQKINLRNKRRVKQKPQKCLKFLK